jgi:predicted dehydrogenase
VVQVGTHRRTSPHTVAAREFIRSGKVGKIGMVRCFVNNAGSGPEKPTPTQPVPPELDWDAWCGPAPLRPYSPAIHPRGFRQYLDYANGTLGDWGIHWFDQLIWITGLRWPKKVFGTGGRPIKGPAVLTATEQTSDAPDHQVATYAFDRLTVQWEHRRFAGNANEKGENVGCYFYGTKGVLHLGWQQGWTFHPANGRDPAVTTPANLNAPDHQNIRELWVDFLRAIRTGSKPAADIGDVHLATNMALLGMVSLKVGRSLEWDGAREQIIGDEAAQRLLRRDYRKGWEFPST